MTAGRVQNFYDCMDSAYDQPEIADYSRQLNHVPLIDVNPRRDVALKSDLEFEEKARTVLNWKPADAIRYNARSGAERTNARLKDEFGGRTVQVKGHAKVYCHLMFGILTLAADQLMRLMT
jgi:Transposase DDE domain